MYSKPVSSSCVMFDLGPSCDYQGVLFWLLLNLYNVLFTFLVVYALFRHVENI